MDSALNVTFLKVDEIAAKLRVSKMTVYRALQSGELPSIRVGRSYRIHEQAFDDYLRSLEAPPSSLETGE